MDKYLVKINWIWAKQFQEVHEFTLHDKSKLIKHVQQFAVKMSRRYSFDCSSLDKPMYPYIFSVDIIPIVNEENISAEDLGIDKFLDNEIEWTKELIENKELYIDGRYNLEVSPKNNL